MPHSKPGQEDWQLRSTTYAYFVKHCRVPTHDEIAGILGLEADGVRSAYRRLHDAHALFLEPGTDQIRILNPFSAVPTQYIVHTNGKSYYANCAWDMLAIPSMLGQDALIQARLEVAETAVEIPVRDGRPQPDRSFLVNYSLPFRSWYDDLVHT